MIEESCREEQLNKLLRRKHFKRSITLKILFEKRYRLHALRCIHKKSIISSRCLIIVHRTNIPPNWGLSMVDLVIHCGYHLLIQP